MTRPALTVRGGEVAEDRGFEPLRAVNPTRFPSERHRPLGESSAQERTCRREHRRIGSSPRWSGAAAAHLHSGQPPVWRHLAQLPQGRKAARVSELCRVRGGPLHVPGRPAASRGQRLPGPSAPPTRVKAWSPHSLSTAATGRRPSPRSSGRSTSPSRCGRRWPATGSTTPTSSAVRAAAARRRARGSWRGRSTASRRRSPTRAGSASAAATWRAAGPGSIDVIEIDAASHGGVDDARDLREKAFFAPVQEPLQGLHHRRGPHGLDAGLQRAAQAGRGAAGAPAVHLRDDRAGEGHPDHPLAHPPLPVPADPAAADVEPTSASCARRRASRSSRRRCRSSCARAAARRATPSRCSTS